MAFFYHREPNDFVGPNNFNNKNPQISVTRTIQWRNVIHHHAPVTQIRADLSHNQEN